MGKGYRIERVAPELYFHFKVKKRITERQYEEIARDLKKLARAAFRESFSKLDVQFEFEIDLEQGSIRGRIRASSRVVVRILQGLALLGGVVAGGQIVWNQSTDALSWLKTEVQEYFEDKYDLSEQIRTERRRGAIARLDHVIARFQEGELTHDEYIDEATAILESIQQSPQRDEIIPALRQYLDSRNVNWEQLAAQLPHNPARPNDPDYQLRMPPAAILRTDERRRPSGLPRRCRR